MNFANMFGSQRKLKSDVLDSKHKIKAHGKEMWNMLHTFSVYLPETCSTEEAQHFTSFVDGVLKFGTKIDPKWETLTIDYIKEHPYNFAARENAMLWICDFHNYVNIVAEKDLFECTKENIARRWGNYSNVMSNI